MNFDELDWRILDRLRATFLSESFHGPAYWKDERDLAQYHVTFGERIGWKWDAALDELDAIGWEPPQGITTILDWGCGSGIAAGRVLRRYPGIRNVLLADSAPVAVQFASAQLATAHPAAHVRGWAGNPISSFILVLSHVWNELDTQQRVELLRLASSAAAILWVEPGTHATARDLQTVRDHFRPAFDIVAPCTHQAACPLLATGMEHHWCHHFADPPPEVFTSSDWSRFADRAGIDLRSLPYSFLAAQARSAHAAPLPANNWERVIGRPRFSKPYARLLCCGEGAACETEITRRNHPDWIKALKHGFLPRRLQIGREGNRAVSLFPPLPATGTDSAQDPADPDVLPFPRDT